MEKIEAQFDALVRQTEEGIITGTSERYLLICSGMLAQSIKRLDASSSRLWKVNIGLTVVMLLVGVLQVCLTMRAH